METLIDRSYKKSLRIAIVSETFPPEVNGVAMTISRFVNALHARGHYIQLIRPQQSASDTPRNTPNFVEHLCYGLAIPRYDGLKFGLVRPKKLVQQWQSVVPDLVYIVTEGPLGFAALSAAKRLKIPVVTSFHTNFQHYSQHYGLSWIHKLVGGYLRSFHNRTQLTMVPTEEIKSSLAAQNYKNLAVVSRGVDTQLFNPQRRSIALRKRWGIADDVQVVMVVSRLAAEKNLPLAVQTFQAMQAQQKKLQLIFVGDGPYREKLLAMCPTAIFTGQLTGVDLAEHYASADFFLLPSVSETYGNVCTEALASGLAVVAYNYAAAHMHIRHGVNGFVAPFDNAELFQQAALQALAQTTTAISAVREAAAQTAKPLDWEFIFDGLEQQLFHVLSQREHFNAPHTLYS